MPRDRKFVAALFALSMVSVLAALDQTVVATALPQIISSLEGVHLLGWVFTAYFLGATATVAVVGKLADLFGRRRVFIASVVVFSVGSLLCGLATSMLMLVLFRLLQGIGAGGIGTCGLIVMADMFAPRERGKWQVINSIGFATASAIGPTVGGLLSDNLSWRWIFLLNVPVCLATIGALLYGLRETQRPAVRPAIDWAGGAWSMLTIASLLLALTWGGREYPWLSPQIGVVLAVCIAAGILLLRVERHAAEPVIPATLLQGNVRLLSTVAAMSNALVWFAVILLVPLRMQLVLGTSATTAGALLTPGIIAGPIAAFIAGQLMSRTGRYRITSLLAGVLQTVGSLLLLLAPAAADPLVVTLYAIVVCFGNGFGGPTFMVMYQNAIPYSQLGAGTGLLSLFRQFGAATGTALAGSIVGAGAAAGSDTALAQAVQQAYALPLVASVVIMLSAWFTVNRPLRSTVHEAQPAASPVGRPTASDTRVAQATSAGAGEARVAQAASAGVTRPLSVDGEPVTADAATPTARDGRDMGGHRRPRESA